TNINIFLSWFCSLSIKTTVSGTSGTHSKPFTLYCTELSRLPVDFDLFNCVSWHRSSITRRLPALSPYTQHGLCCRPLPVVFVLGSAALAARRKRADLCEPAFSPLCATRPPKQQTHQAV